MRTNTATWDHQQPAPTNRELDINYWWLRGLISDREYAAMRGVYPIIRKPRRRNQHARIVVAHAKI